MRKAFLIGFKYKDNKKLPGITVDLYQVYSFLKKKGWKDEEIEVFTDIEKDEQTDILKISILEKTVDSNILSFIQDLKERKQYNLFNPYTYYTSFNSFFKNKGDNCFLYYTGHFEGGNIILPNNSLISISSFLSDLEIYKEILLVMDCCENKINFPFVLHDRIYRFENINFFKAKIICIASSLENENSITSRAGSFFTKYLFHILEDPNLDVSNILKHIKIKLHNNRVKQTANISASYPNLFLLFRWFYSLTNLQIEIYPDYIEIF